MGTAYFSDMLVKLSNITLHYLIDRSRQKNNLTSSANK